MKRVFIYLFTLLLVYCAIGVLVMLNEIAVPNETIRIVIYCGLMGGVGGITYCLRGIYLNACVFKQWDKQWLPWYFIRPLVSVICGTVSWLFQKGRIICTRSAADRSSNKLRILCTCFCSGT